jgi:membrane protease subunit HflK
MEHQEFNIQDYFRQVPPQRMGRWALSGLIALVAIVLLVSALYSVGADQVAVIQRFGRFVRTTPPGLHVRLPFGIESLRKVKVKYVFKEEFGFRTVEPGVRTVYSQQNLLDEALMLTGDLNCGVVEWIVQYKVKDPVAYSFNVRHVRGTIRDVAEAAMRRVVGDRSIDGVLTVERIEVGQMVQEGMQEILDSYESGVQIVTVKLQDVNPPDEVKPAFNAVNEAKQEREQLINQAMKEYNTAVPRAEGDAEKTIKMAEGSAIDRVNRAKGDAKRFLALWKSYRWAKDVTRRRLYMETMAEVLPKVEHKYVVDEDETGVLRLLPLGQPSGQKEVTNE